MSDDELKVLRHECAEQTALADAGEASAVFLHELGNMLNNILLQAKLMQQEAPANLQPRLAQTCKHIMHSAQNMKHLAQFRQSRRATPYPVDLNAVIIDAVTGSNVRLDLEAELPPIKGSVADVKRLVKLLIHNARQADADTHLVAISTALQDGELTLRVQSDNLRVDEQVLPQLFEPFRQLGGKPDSLELAICRELVRRMRGQLSVEQNNHAVGYVAKWTVT